MQRRTTPDGQAAALLDLVDLAQGTQGTIDQLRSSTETDHLVTLLGQMQNLGPPQQRHPGRGRGSYRSTDA